MRVTARIIEIFRRGQRVASMSVAISATGTERTLTTTCRVHIGVTLRSRPTGFTAGPARSDQALKGCSLRFSPAARIPNRVLAPALAF